MEDRERFPSVAVTVIPSLVTVIMLVVAFPVVALAE